MDTKFKFSTIIYIITSLAVLSVIAVPCHFLGMEALLDRYADMNYFDLLMSQIANTLIVLSLTSVLSSDFGQAYWVDIKATKLIAPFWGCFIAITVYLLTGLVYSVISYAIGFHAGIVISAIGATVLLVILTFQMISIYFGKEELKKQLWAVYQKKMILVKSSYVSDYLRRLEAFEEYIKQKHFHGKSRFMDELRREIEGIKEELDSGDEARIEECHKDHVAIFIEGQDELECIDLKIQEYTQNAISNNETVVVRENIELLVEAGNYTTFFRLLEELFDWDEKYACQILRQISRKDTAWMVKDKMNFFKQYALQKLISESGKLEALQNLLILYDPTNLGMGKLKPEIRTITDQCREVQKNKAQLDRELSIAEDFMDCRRKQRDQRKKLIEDDAALREQLLKLLSSATAKDLRMYYIPIREARLAYEEGNYEIANKYITVILTDFEQDRLMIQSLSGLSEIDAETEFTFSYVTAEEKAMIDQLLEKDKTVMAIPEDTKNRLASLDRVRLGNFS